MCGIIAYLGHRAVTEILVNGLRRMEYRGYDSAGVGVIDGNSGALKVVKRVGKVINLEKALLNQPVNGTLGIAHTRWATHGAPSDLNSHPHCNASSSIAVCHNGIIENYASLKTDLQSRGYIFQSETDTEVLAHLIDEVRKADEWMSLTDAVGMALKQVRGTFGVCVVDRNDPDVLVGARQGSPLILGIGEEGDEYFLASDASAIVQYTNKVAIPISFLSHSHHITIVLLTNMVPGLSCPSCCIFISLALHSYHITIVLLTNE